MKWKLSTIGAIAARLTLGHLYPPVGRKAEYFINAETPNLLNEPTVLTALRRRGKISDDYFYQVCSYQGLDKTRADELFSLTERLNEVAELSQLAWRGIITVTEYKERMKLIGVSEEMASELLKLAEARFDPDVVIRAWRRNIQVSGGKPEYFDDLRDQGWTDDRIELLKKVTEYFPSPNDLILFAVREVYNPEIVAKYGQMEDLPPKFLEEAKKAGLPEEQAKNYWAAHWVLPSLGQGYEMMQRGVISQEELMTLMRTQDIMPYWRDKLMKISYNPLTRVDVRRMHKLGVLDRAGVKRAYLDTGYSEENAEKMTEFTIKYNEEPEEAEKTEADKRKEELKGLTREAILKQYSTEMISRQEAGDYLKGLGYSDEVIDFYLSRADYLKEEEKVDAYTKAFHRLYVNGIIDYNELVDALGKLNLPDANVQYLINLWDLEKMQKPSQPSKSELISFAKKGIISLDTLKQMLSNLGYSLEYIYWYLKDAKLIKAEE